MARKVKANKGYSVKLPAMYDELTWQERSAVRQRYEALQNGDCWYCDWPLDGPPADQVQWAQVNLRLFPPGFLNTPIHLQHDHNTGLTEGAVHARCNAVLWQYEGR